VIIKNVYPIYLCMIKTNVIVLFDHAGEKTK
jgi:hypothetical protein